MATRVRMESRRVVREGPAKTLATAAPSKAAGALQKASQRVADAASSCDAARIPSCTCTSDLRPLGGLGAGASEALKSRGGGSNDGNLALATKAHRSAAGEARSLFCGPFRDARAENGAVCRGAGAHFQANNLLPGFLCCMRASLRHLKASEAPPDLLQSDESFVQACMCPRAVEAGNARTGGGREPRTPGVACATPQNCAMWFSVGCAS